nr:MAG TPA: hypothetical protein [Caudoviricetes sp.]
MLLIPMFYRKNNISPFVCCEFVTHVLFVYILLLIIREL